MPDSGPDAAQAWFSANVDEAVTKALEDGLAAAMGRERRADPVLAGTGGPAGNARLTAWTGLILLMLFLAELVTLLDVHGLISWHLALGILLVPPALLKTGTTGWRILRYYTGNTAYRSAGPPPLLLRVLGPLVVLTTLALLGTGVALVLVGATQSREPLFTVLDQQVDVLMLHKAAFLVWAAATGLHVLARLVPAWHLTLERGPRVPGLAWRGLILLVVGVVAVPLVAWGLASSGGWRDNGYFGPPPAGHRPPPGFKK